MPPSPAPADEYQVSHLGLTRGPFRFDLVEAMILAGAFPKDVKIRKKNDKQWAPAPPAGQTPEGVSFANLSPLRQSSVTTAIGFLGAVGLLLAAFLLVLAVTSIADRQKTPVLAASATPTPRPAATPQKALATSGPATRQPANNLSSSLPYSNVGRQTGTSLSKPPVTQPVRKAVPVSTPVATPLPTAVYTDSLGNTYRVSNYDYQRLQQWRQRIDAEKSILDRQQASLDESGRDVDLARRGVNRYSQSSVNAFNAKVNRYNAQMENVQGAIDRFNRKVAEFNADLRRVGTLIR